LEPAVSFDPISVIEAAYRPAPDLRAWLRGVIEAAQADLDDGLGLMAYVFDGSGDRMNIEECVGQGTPDGLTGRLTSFLHGAPRIAARVVAFAPPCCTNTQLTRGMPRELVPALPPGVGDCLGVTGADPTLRGCVLAAPMAKAGSAPARLVARWSRLGGHLAAGLRLRRALGPQPELSLPPEAIVDRRGRIANAIDEAKAPSALESLREAAIAVARAQEQLRGTDSEGAVASWQVLFSGRWSLVDHFDRDGKRYFVARRNDPEVAAPAALTLRERQVVGFAALGHPNKVIAYELGLSVSTVASHLASASRKLGVSSRQALIQRMRA
jgi:DNA-binding CsgD family transcriptional regulator